MSHKYEHSDEFIKTILNKYEVAYDDVCWEKLKSDLPKRIAKKNVFDNFVNEVKKINISKKKIVAIGILSLFLLVILSYFLFFSNSTQKTVSVTEVPIPIKTEQTETSPVQKNNLPATEKKILPEAPKQTFLPEKAVSKLPISVQTQKQPVVQKTIFPANKFPTKKTQLLTQKTKKDSTMNSAVSPEKSATDNNFDFVKSVEKNKVSDPLALPDSTGSSKKQKKNFPSTTSESTDSIH